MFLKLLTQFAVWLTCLLAVQLCFAQAQSESQLFHIEKDGKSGFIDRTGKVVIPPQFDNVSGFREGLALAMRNGKKFFIDRSGKTVFEASKKVIAPQFEDAQDFSEGLAPVKVRSDETTWCPREESGSRKGFTMKWGYIDKTGKLVIPAQYESVGAFSEGLAAINNCDSAFFIDKTGKKVISGDFRYATSFSGGLARVDVTTKDGPSWGYIDRTGRIVWGLTK